MTGFELASTSWPSNAPGTMPSSCQGSTCSFASYMWFAMVMASCCPFVAFCCCCICNKWYLNSGPYAGLTDDQICPHGKRCSQACWIFCFWCCPTICRPPPSPSDNDNVISIDVTTATTFNVTSAPPPYDVAATMARPSNGEVVIFVCDETFCSFKYSNNGGDCDPPAYKFLEPTDGSGSSNDAHVMTEE